MAMFGWTATHGFLCTRTSPRLTKTNVGVGIHVHCGERASCCMLSSDPEFIVVWAWRQRGVARQRSGTFKGVILDSQNKLLMLTCLTHRLWSRVHGFFAVMGSFVDGKEVLSLDRIE
jgi:hypothetical protein